MSWLGLRFHCDLTDSKWKSHKKDAIGLHMAP